MRWLHRQESLRSMARLFNTNVVKRNVRLSLMTIFGIPDGLPMTP
jgi:hypothetical protein